MIGLADVLGPPAMSPDSDDLSRGWTNNGSSLGISVVRCQPSIPLAALRAEPPCKGHYSMLSRSSVREGSLKVSLSL
jgi:hypothetical protein